MKKLLVALLFLPSIAGAAWVSTNGSTVTMVSPNNNTTAIPTTVSNSTMTIQLPSGVLLKTDGSGVTQPISAVSLPTHAVTQSGPWTIGNLNGVVISSFASTALPMSNVVMVASSPVATSSKAGEQLVSVEIAGSSNTVAVAGLNGVVISSYAATVGPMENLVMVGSSPIKTSGTAGEQLVSVEISGSSNTVNAAQSGTWNIATVTTLTGITNALPAGTNNLGTIGGLNNVVISSFAATSTPQVNVVMVASTPVVTAGGQAGEIRVSAEISGSSDTFQGGLAHNGAAAATNRIGTTPAIVQTTPANGTALTAGRDAALSVGTDGNLWVSNQPAMRPASYYASVSSASYTSTTDLACLPGNATNTVIVRRIVVSCTETTAGQVTVSVIRRSAADSGGTSANMPVGKDDSTSGSAVSVPLVYSAAPTKGTLDSFVDIQTIGCMASATATPNDVLVENWTDKAKVLRGTAQEFCVSLATPQDLAGTTVTGGNFNVHFEWNEITTITP